MKWNKYIMEDYQSNIYANFGPIRASSSREID
jgi:hypothetical protein